jgi:NAD(P)-dependent dehydrogenase (short-subunit alcohol dehydrogenase family)
LKEFGRVDVLVNNTAHQISHEGFMELTAEAPNPQCPGGYSAPMPPSSIEFVRALIM